MAYGEFKVSGDDVLEALTYCSAHSDWERALNDEGHKLAELIVERVLGILAAKIALKLPEDGE